MKANELMIGDWIQTKLEEDEPKIAIVTTIEWGICGFPSAIEVKGHNAPYYEDEVEPIPLTEDILKANGFVNSANNAVERWLVYSDYDNSIVIEYKTKTLLVVGRDCEGGVNRVHLLDIFHVHELQHALRLCGLSELADDFKVE